MKTVKLKWYRCFLILILLGLNLQGFSAVIIRIN